MTYRRFMIESAVSEPNSAQKLYAVSCMVLVYIEDTLFPVMALDFSHFFAKT